jgi:hypothetical protein
MREINFNLSVTIEENDVEYIEIHKCDLLAIYIGFSLCFPKITLLFKQAVIRFLGKALKTQGEIEINIYFPFAFT